MPGYFVPTAPGVFVYNPTNILSIMGNVIKLNVEGVVVLVPLLLKPCLTQIFHLVA